MAEEEIIEEAVEVAEESLPVAEIVGASVLSLLLVRITGFFLDDCRFRQFLCRETPFYRSWF